MPAKKTTGAKRRDPQDESLERSIASLARLGYSPHELKRMFKQVDATRIDTIWSEQRRRK